MSRPINDAYIIALREIINSSPFPQHMAMRLEALELDFCRILLDADERHLQPFGIVHGGALATLIDTATFWATFLRLPEGTGLVNVDLKLNYLQTARVGQLTAEGRCIRAGRTISYAEASVTDAAGTLLAHGTSTLMALPGKGFDLAVSKYMD
jgi:uncharacterized protein (TIGR00369 family)